MFACLKSCAFCRERPNSAVNMATIGNTEVNEVENSKDETTKTITNNDMSLSDDQLERLSQVTVATKMETIAISHLKIQSETVANLKITHQGNTTGFNRAVLTIWKCMNPGDNQAQVSFTSLPSVYYFVNCPQNKKTWTPPLQICQYEQVKGRAHFSRASSNLQYTRELRTGATNIIIVT